MIIIYQLSDTYPRFLRTLSFFLQSFSILTWRERNTFFSTIFSKSSLASVPIFFNNEPPFPIKIPEFLRIYQLLLQRNEVFLLLYSKEFFLGQFLLLFGACFLPLQHLPDIIILLQADIP